MFGNRHSIIELPSIPRERAALQQLINQARHELRISRLMRWAAINIVVWALIVLFVWRPLYGPRTHEAPPPVSNDLSSLVVAPINTEEAVATYYLPIISKGELTNE